MFDLKWKVAKIGFTLMKPWIAEQFVHDEDDVQIEEILNDVIEEALNEVGIKSEQIEMPEWPCMRRVLKV